MLFVAFRNTANNKAERKVKTVPKKTNHQRTDTQGQTVLYLTSWQLASYCGAHTSTLASVATATSATEVITSTHRIATHQQNNQTIYKQQTSHHQAIVEEHSVAHLPSTTASAHHAQHRKRKAADGGHQNSKPFYSNSTANNISTGATILSSSSIYHQKSSSHSLKMTAGHKGSGQKVINKVNFNMKKVFYHLK